MFRILRWCDSETYSDSLIRLGTYLYELYKFTFNKVLMMNDEVFHVNFVHVSLCMYIFKIITFLFPAYFKICAFICRYLYCIKVGFTAAHYPRILIPNSRIIEMLRLPDV